MKKNMNNSINKIDILLEIYNEIQLNPEKLKSLINDNHYDLYISSPLIILLIKKNIYKNKSFISKIDFA